MSKKHAIWLSQCDNIGSVKAKLLIDYYETAENVYNAKYEELKSIEGITKAMLGELLNKDLTEAERVLRLCEKAGCEVLAITDKTYPERLRNIYDPPTVLYIKGKLPEIDALAVVGVVGTRQCTPYGYKNTERICRELSQAGIIIATGMARGIDTAAATGALQGKMPVIGVIGCGMDKIYPASNKPLYDKVLVKGGAIISEYPPGLEARPAFFPMRNRIISALSLGTAVIEAPERSGALITAQRALEQSRDVFVLPGNVDSPACMGSNKLLREGAIPFLKAEDIVEEYKEIYSLTNKPIDKNERIDYIDLEKITAGLNKSEAEIVKTIGFGSLFIDEIIAKSGITAHTAMASLTGLEIGGLVRRNNTGKWEIRS